MASLVNSMNIQKKINTDSTQAFPENQRKGNISQLYEAIISQTRWHYKKIF